MAEHRVTMGWTLAGSPVRASGVETLEGVWSGRAVLRHGARDREERA
jgi:hypothetical protein